jgi:signal transduction histidine kinase
VGGIAFIRDITERCRIEEALRQSQKMEAIGQLTGGVAHDFNNLLTIILGNLALLRRKLGDRADIAALADTAEQAGLRGAALTEQLLAFSRRQHLRPEPLDLCSVVQGIDAMLRRPLGRDITLALDVAPELPPVLVDRNQLEVAVLNLVINARDAMPQGGRIRITGDRTDLSEIADRREDKTVSGEYLKVTVSDTGIGMSATTRERIFEPFFTTKEVGKGTGLGLSQVYGFVQQSGGHITVDSREGIGTAVSLFLPVASESPAILRSAVVGEPVGSDL